MTPMRHDKYILDALGRPVACPDTLKWAHWFETSKKQRKVGSTQVGPSKVSTIFLGLDHAFSGTAPVLWETMVFGGKLNGHQQRSSGSWEQAEAMHAAMVQSVHIAEQLPFLK